MIPNPIAIMFGDLHLTLQRPACRADKDWMKTQANYLNQIKQFADRLPILCTGDIFDRWNAPPELINFALQHLPDDMLCVPGQHDLPNHRLDLMHRSGYGVLKEVGKIVDISGGEPFKTDNFVAIGFGWDEEITPLRKRLNDSPHIAVIHKYVFLDKSSAFKGASEELSYSKLERILRTYDSACIGDNHIHWMI